MKTLKYLFVIIFVVVFAGVFAFAQTSEKPGNPNFDAELAKKLGADQYGMKNYVLVILKTGPKDADFKGKERDAIFAGHLANIRKLGEMGKLAVAGPFGKNDKAFRGLFIFNVATIEAAQKLVETDPAFKAGIFIADMTPWYGTAALMQVNETHKKIFAKSF